MFRYKMWSRAALPSHSVHRPLRSCSGCNRLFFQNLTPRYLNLSKLKPCYSATVSSMSSPTVVEHIVLFKVKEGTSIENQNQMFSALNELKVLDGVLELSAGPLSAGPGLELWQVQKQWAGGFTHMLRVRYKDKSALAAYGVHPSHVHVVETHVKPNCDDILVLDWEGVPYPPAVDGNLDIIRVGIFKLKEGITEEEIAQLQETFSSSPDVFPSVSQICSGPNFSARAKGYNYGVLACFKSVIELEALMKSPEYEERKKAKVDPLVESVIMMDLARETAKL